MLTNRQNQTYNKCTHVAIDTCFSVKGLIVKIVIYFALLLSVSSCSNFIQDRRDDFLDRHYSGKASGHNLVVLDEWAEIESYTDIARWINKNVTYKSDGGSDHFQGPEETITLGTGDCEDFALLFMNIAYVVFGTKFDLAVVDHTKQVVDGGHIDHAELVLGNVSYSAFSGREIIRGSIGYRYSFGHVYGGSL